MKLKTISLFVCLLLVALQIQAQIGVATIGLASPGRGAATGSANSIGKTALPFCKPKDLSCSSAVAYIFIGNGYWNVETNWLGNSIPPQLLPLGETIIINPEQGGECLLNIPQTISAGAVLNVIAEKRINIVKPLVLLK